MARFYMHLCNGRARTIDDRGQIFDDLDAARQGAVDALRQAMSWDVQGGEICIASYIELEDESHHRLTTVHFADAITVLTVSACDPPQPS